MVPIAVGIINHNTRELLRNCIWSVCQEQPVEMVVVDNASTDGSADMVAQRFPDVTLISNQANLGYGAAANQVVASSTADTVFLLNSDTRLHPGGLEAIVAFLHKHPRTALLGPRLINPDGSCQPSCFPFPTPLDVFLDASHIIRLARLLPWTRERSLRTWSHAAQRKVPWVSGAALAVRRSAFEAVHGFDPAFFMYYEEVDLCFRLSKAGWQTVYLPSVEVVHLGGASTRQQHSAMLVEFYASLARFYRRHYSLLRSIQLACLVRGIAAGRLARDRFRLPLAPTTEARQMLQGNIIAWRQLLGLRFGRQVADRSSN